MPLNKKTKPKLKQTKIELIQGGMIKLSPCKRRHDSISV